MHFRYTPVPDWPPLAWLACGHRGDPTVEVFHGPDVETTPDGFSEAGWDGEFARAGFDETDLVFGSGARRRGGGVSLISACAPHVHPLSPPSRPEGSEYNSPASQSHP